MEYLFQINPILMEHEIIIYGIGQEQKRIFMALLQQNVSVTAFCLKEHQKVGATSFFGKKIIHSLQELREYHANAWVILSANDSIDNSELLREAGIQNIVIENITVTDFGILMEDDRKEEYESI